MSEPQSSVQSLVTAHAVLRTVRHILSVSNDLEDARRQIERLQELVRQKADEQHVPTAMLQEAGRELLIELL